MGGCVSRADGSGRSQSGGQFSTNNTGTGITLSLSDYFIMIFRYSVKIISVAPSGNDKQHHWWSRLFLANHLKL